jgi:DNA-binding transcriptional MerR regulator
VSAPEGTLTIGQLAEYVGVTTRAIRHYHERGLLAEPARDASGYRRYGAAAVLDLIRIKILADAGVPLARIDEVLGAGPEQLARSVAGIDAALRERIRELEHRRERIADLAGGERMFLAPELVAFLDELRAAGVGEHAVETERDGWVLLMAREPERALEWIEEKRAHLGDPAFRELYRAYGEALDWSPADPRLEALADAMVDYLGERSEPTGTTSQDPTVTALLLSYLSDASSPALERLNELVEERAREGG